MNFIYYQKTIRKLQNKHKNENNFETFFNK